MAEESDELSVDLVMRMLGRERAARREAERLLEDRSRKLYTLNVALEQQVSLIQVVLDTAADGIIVFRSDGEVELCNVAARRIFGLEPDQQANLADLFVNSPLSQLTEGNQASPQEDFELEVEGVRKDIFFPVELRITQFPVEEDFRYSCMLRDLTLKKKKEAERAISQKMESVGRLAAGVAHELNSPIQYVADNTRFLKDSYGQIQNVLSALDQLVHDCDGNEALSARVGAVRQAQEEAEMEFLLEEIPEALEQTLFGAEAVARIVGAMKEFSHPGSTEFYQVSLNAALNSTLTVSKNLWKQRAEVECHFCDDLPDIDCLPAELNQVFLNLIVNAADAIESRWGKQLGTITVTTSDHGDHVVVEIADNGSGIPADLQQKIFDPFFTTKGVGKGTGQGLSICHEIIRKQHCGRLLFDSAVGVGTTFRIELPKVQTAVATPSE